MKGDFSRDSFDPSQHYSAVLMQQGRVQLDADWNEQQAITRHRIATEAVDVIGQSGAPRNNAGFAIQLVKDSQTGESKLTIGAGRYYVDGILCEQDVTIDYTDQPDLPLLSDTPMLLDLLTTPDTTAAIVYLHAFERHETWLDNPQIREVALGGADTTSRLRTVWQVKLLLVQTPDGPPDCAQDFDEWDALIAPSSGMLAVRTNAAAGGSNDPCLLAPLDGYRRLENQLYRVEIHEGGDLDKATFKWSRDNGSVVAAIVQAIDGDKVTVHDLGPDELLGFAIGQWVEIIDDRGELNGLPGEMAQIRDIDTDIRQITLSTTPADIDQQRHPRLRRWDGFASIKAATGAPASDQAPDGGWIRAEDTIEVGFSNGSYKTGDYWTIPARTATAAIEWPHDSNGTPLPQPPRGIRHHYARLALAWLDSNLNASPPVRITDCRRLFVPLADTPQAIHITDVNWENDALLPAAQFTANGLTVWLDAEPEPLSINPSTVIVALEANLPATPQAPSYKVSAILDGTIKRLDPRAFQWLPTSAANQLVTAAAASTPGLRLRVQLKGHAIWGMAPTAAGQPAERRYLDGQAFGMPAPAGGQDPAHIALSFPSGAGMRASDFESWLYLTKPPTDPLQITKVSFVSAIGRQQTEIATWAGRRPPRGNPVVQFFESANVNGILITFSRAIRSENLANVFKVTGTNVAGAITDIDVEVALDSGGEVVQIALKSPSRQLPVSSPTFDVGSYRLMVSGKPTTPSTPIVRANDDGSPLDGNADNQPGDNFLLDINVQPAPARPPGGKPRPERGGKPRPERD